MVTPHPAVIRKEVFAEPGVALKMSPLTPLFPQRPISPGVEPTALGLERMGCVIGWHDFPRAWWENSQDGEF